MPAVRKWQLNIQWTHTWVLGQCVHPRGRSGTTTEFGVPIRSQTRHTHITTCPLPAWSRLQGTHPYVGHRTDSPGSDNHTEHPGKVGLGGVVGGMGQPRACDIYGRKQQQPKQQTSRTHLCSQGVAVQLRHIGDPDDLSHGGPGAVHLQAPCLLQPLALPLLCVRPPGRSQKRRHLRHTSHEGGTVVARLRGMRAKERCKVGCGGKQPHFLML